MGAHWTIGQWRRMPSNARSGPGAWMVQRERKWVERQALEERLARQTSPLELI